MSSKPKTLALILAATFALAGCGGSSHSSSNPAVSPTAKPTAVVAASVVAQATPVANTRQSSRVQLSEFANAINLRPQDMAGFTAKPKERGGRSGLVNDVKDKAQYERCLGVDKATKPAFKRASDRFVASGHNTLSYLEASSEIQVAHTRASAKKELATAQRVMDSPQRRQCLTHAFEAFLGGSHTTHIKGHQVRITIGNTRVAPLDVNAAVTGTRGGWGFSLRFDVTYTFVMRGRNVAVPAIFYIDGLDFVVGRASIGLVTMALGQPFPSEREASLFSLLVSRALDASRHAPTIAL